MRGYGRYLALQKPRRHPLHVRIHRSDIAHIPTHRIDECTIARKQHPRNGYSFAGQLSKALYVTFERDVPRSTDELRIYPGMKL